MAGFRAGEGGRGAAGRSRGGAEWLRPHRPAPQEAPPVRLPPSLPPPPPPASRGGGAAMQQYFSLADCEVMGFDLDHTLCRYHLPQSATVSAGTARPQSQGCPLRSGRPSGSASEGVRGRRGSRVRGVSRGETGNVRGGEKREPLSLPAPSAGLSPTGGHCRVFALETAPPKCSPAWSGAEKGRVPQRRSRRFEVHSAFCRGSWQTLSCLER